ncbi:MAG: DUF4097 family beta strand repeat-containing protein, partial [Candidatus Eiseniibacteriota bacterium]
TWDQDAVEVDVVYRARFTMVGAGKEPDFSVEFEQTGNVLRVTGREGSVAMVGIYLSTDIAEYRYTIRAPAWLAVDTDGEDGDVHVTGLRGEVRCRLEDGDVTLAGLGGPHVQVDLEDGSVQIDGAKTAEGRVSVEDGDVRMEGCAGSWTVSAEDGSVDLREHRAGPLEIRSVDGNVDLQLVAGDVPDVDIEAEDGSVDVEVVRAVSTAFLLVTEDGGIEIVAPAARRLEQQEGRAYGELGDAKGEMRIRTTDGSITLRAVGGGA